MISNGLVGLCGEIYAQYQGAADVNMGRGAIVSDLQQLSSAKLFSENSVQERKLHLHLH